MHRLLSMIFVAALLTACGSEQDKENPTVSVQAMADGLYSVMAADRTAYTRYVVNRLVNEEGVVEASEHWQDDKALPLPAQMFRFGAELSNEASPGFSYSLQSLWPINKQNAPRTDLEKMGLKFVADNPGKRFYGEEKLGDVTYYTAVYADTAVSPACVECHNQHKDTPRDDFEIGDVMGGVVIRIPLQ